MKESAAVEEKKKIRRLFFDMPHYAVKGPESRMTQTETSLSD